MCVCVCLWSSEPPEDEAAADEEEDGCFLTNRGGLKVLWVRSATVRLLLSLMLLQDTENMMLLLKQSEIINENHVLHCFYHCVV